MFTTEHVKVIRSFPGQGVRVYGKDLNQICQFPGYDNARHRGWYLWNLLRDLMKQGVVKQVQGGRGRLSIYELV